MEIKKTERFYFTGSKKANDTLQLLYEQLCVICEMNVKNILLVSFRTNTRATFFDFHLALIYTTLFFFFFRFWFMLSTILLLASIHTKESVIRFSNG